MKNNRKLLLRGVVEGSEHWVIDKTETRRYRNSITGKYKATRHIKLSCGHAKKLSTWKHEVPLRTHCEICADNLRNRNKRLHGEDSLKPPKEGEYKIYTEFFR